MSEIYIPTNERGHPLASLALGGLCVVAVFAIFPLLQSAANLLRPTNGPEVVQEPITLPEPIVEQPDPPIVKLVDPPKPILEEPKPLPTLDEVIAFINAGDGGSAISGGLGGWTGVNTGESIAVYLPSQLDSKPRVLVAVKPLYPYSMKGIDGQVTVEFIIDENGKVIRPRIYRSTHREFEQAAIDAVKKSQWEPGVKDGENVSSIARLPVDFKK